MSRLILTTAHAIPPMRVVCVEAKLVVNGKRLAFWKVACEGCQEMYPRYSAYLSAHLAQTAVEDHKRAHGLGRL